MRSWTWLLAAIVLAGGGAKAEDANAAWRQVFDGIATEYRLVRPGAADGESLSLVDRPTYTWARSGPNDGTYGAVYVWTYRGNAESVACFWRSPGADGKVAICHELHSLSPVALESRGEAASSWKPKTGVKRTPLPEAPVPAGSAVGRMSQMRAICRDLTARSEGAAGDRTELRLLPQPLYRYQSTNPDVIDGALFAFVCSVGTDPEVFLQLEALQGPEGPQWHYTLSRFSHMDLFATFQDQEIWRALRDRDNPISRNADHTYWVFHTPFDRAKLGTSAGK